MKSWCDFIANYHLEVQANPKKIAQKNDVISSIFLIHEAVEVDDRDVEFWGFNLEILQLFLKVWLLTSRRDGRPLYDKQFQSSDLFHFAIFYILL